MRAMKDSGVEWIGEIPQDWEIIKARHIFSQRNEKGNSVCLQLLSPSQKYGVIPQTLLEELTTHRTVKLKEDTNLSELKTVHQGDFCISLRSFQGGFEYSKYEGVVSSAYQIFYKVTNDFDGYFKYMFKDSSFISKMNSYAMNLRDGKNISFFDFGNSYLPLPPCKEQQCIASYLDSKCSKIDSIIEKQQAVIEKLKEYKLSVITEAVTKGLNPDVEMKDSGVEWIGEVPKHWENKKLLSVLSMRVIDGPHESPTLVDEGVPYISATAIENGKINFDKKRGYITAEYCDECDKRYKPQKNDILLIKLGASTGQVAIVETEGRFNIWVPLAAIRCSGFAVPKFVYYAFKSDYYIKQMEQSWTYGTQQTLGVKTIERLRLLCPNVEEQNRIVSFLDDKCKTIDTAVVNREKIVSKLEEYKKSLIYEVVTGKKEV